MPCNKCGACCEDIGFDMDIETLASKFSEQPDNPDSKFIIEHWNLKPDSINRYSCEMYDSVNKICTAYESRPPTCSDYPFYRSIDDKHFPEERFPQCSYWDEVNIALIPKSVSDWRKLSGAGNRQTA